MLDLSYDTRYGNLTDTNEVTYEQTDSVEQYAAVPFERTRRITGYLVGTTDRWCNAKLKELNDRVGHTGIGE